MENIHNSPTAVAAQEGPSVSVVGDTYLIVIGSEQTRGVYALIDMLIPPKGGPGPHSHATFQEAFYIVDGEIKLKQRKRCILLQKARM
jgi:quercetin dioxygenase-like cupin family protein